MSQLMIVIRSFGKVELLDAFKGRQFKVGAEIGIYNAEFSDSLLRLMPDLTFYMIDPYKHWPDDIYDDVGNDNQEIQDARYELVKVIANKYGDRAKLLRMTSIEALGRVPDNSLDFVYIDANHKYEFVKQDIKGWYKKVKPNGIIAGHDFSDQFPSVKLAVVNFCHEQEIEIVKIGTADNVWMVEKGNRK
jgi:hypothetical protein